MARQHRCLAPRPDGPVAAQLYVAGQPRYPARLKDGRTSISTALGGCCDVLRPEHGSCPSPVRWVVGDASADATVSTCLSGQARTAIGCGDLPRGELRRPHERTQAGHQPRARTRHTESLPGHPGQRRARALGDLGPRPRPVRPGLRDRYPGRLVSGEALVRASRSPGKCVQRSSLRLVALSARCLDQCDFRGRRDDEPGDGKCEAEPRWLDWTLSQLGIPVESAPCSPSDHQHSRHGCGSRPLAEVNQPVARPDSPPTLPDRHGAHTATLPGRGSVCRQGSRHGSGTIKKCAAFARELSKVSPLRAGK